MRRTQITFDYRHAPVPVPSEIQQTHERAWLRLGRPGNWWTGAERIEIAAETRNAIRCQLCRERKAAVSPFALEGEHQHSATRLEPLSIDVVHRITTDATRLTKSWQEQLEHEGLDDGRYVEALGIIVAVLSIDEFHRGLGIPLAPLPEAIAGEPDRQRPAGLRSAGAWVPMLDLEATRGTANEDLYAGLPVAPNVISAMSLVPDAVRQLNELSAVHYLPIRQVMDPTAAGQTLTRPQMELIAGRVSALNECFF